MRRIASLSILIFLTACTFRPGLWTWQHPDPRYAELHLAEDISECEYHAMEEAMDGPLYRIVNAREYGGWGNFDFEFCMRQRGWDLEFVPK